MSCVTCHLIYTYIFFYKVVELNIGGFVIIGAYPV